MKSIHYINKKWNKLKYISDYSQFGQKDVWQTPKEFLENGQGDCEDFAIAKFFDLLELSYDPWLVYCYIKRTKESHMVCVVDRIILDLTGEYDMNMSHYSPVLLVYGFNLHEYKIFRNYAPIGKDLGVNKLSKWMNLLSRMDL